MNTVLIVILVVWEVGPVKQHCQHCRCAMSDMLSAWLALTSNCEDTGENTLVFDSTNVARCWTIERANILYSHLMT